MAGPGMSRAWVSLVSCYAPPMKIVIAGATGFLGKPLVARLIRDRHDVVVLTRSDPRDASTSSLPARAAAVRWNPDGLLDPGHPRSTAPTPS